MISNPWGRVGVPHGAPWEGIFAPSASVYSYWTVFSREPCAACTCSLFLTEFSVFCSKCAPVH
eukprot:6770808-Prymnesium_polylepis.1